MVSSIRGKGLLCSSNLVPLKYTDMVLLLPSRRRRHGFIDIYSNPRKEKNKNILKKWQNGVLSCTTVQALIPTVGCIEDKPRGSAALTFLCPCGALVPANSRDQKPERNQRLEDENRMFCSKSWLSQD